ncbi:hypothetical protein TrVE_jg2701 [Triparma verrucosa]|uniref:Uncharacterized protein n=1 Tax=Triparma verrucosa TaxID=1606542 RepID=A0A9W7BGJ5_9STRA|nr:hypothetical protein TrVE_jg2701 [Triparma verrucosa]
MTYNRRKTRTIPTPDWLKEEQNSVPPPPPILPVPSEGLVEDAWLDRRIEGLQGGQTIIRVEELDELFKPEGLKRLKLRESPLTGLSLIFDLSLLLPSLQPYFDEAWSTVEEDFGLERRFEWEGKLEDVVERRYGVRDFMECKKISLHYHTVLTTLFSTITSINSPPSCLNFLSKLQAEGCSLSVHTSLPSSHCPRFLELSGLSEYVEEYVTPNDGYENHQQSLLGLCLKLRNQPRQCVVFEGELYINQIQRLFSEDTDDEPEFELEMEVGDGGGGGAKNRNARRWD